MREAVALVTTRSPKVPGIELDTSRDWRTADWCDGRRAPQVSLADGIVTVAAGGHATAHAWHARFQQTR